jgi:hypothetical protein
MKELIDKLIAAIPVYVRQMIELLRNPREFIGQIDLESDDAVKEALTFLAISFGLAFIAQIPLLPEKQNKEVLFGAAAVMAALSFAVSILLLLVSWKVVGGKMTFKKFITVTSYFSGVSTLLLLIFTLLGQGLFSGIDPESARQGAAGGYMDPVDLMKSAGYQAFLLLFAVGFVVVFIWIFRIWGTYRELNQVSKVRSIIAFVVYMLLSPLAIGLQMLMAQNLLGVTPPPFPAELAGQWEITRGSRSSDVAVNNLMTYTFTPKGYYTVLVSKAATNGRCNVTINNVSYGHATVSGSTLTLHVAKHTETNTDTCNSKKSEFVKDSTNEVYQYAIRQSPDGQQLCLTGKLGEACLSPKKQ